MTTANKKVPVGSLLQAKERIPCFYAKETDEGTMLHYVRSLQVGECFIFAGAATRTWKRRTDRMMCVLTSSGLYVTTYKSDRKTSLSKVVD